MHARHYNPQIGRFTSVDPVWGTAKRPQSWNRFAYALDSPVTMRDPDGKFALVFIVGADPRRLKSSFGHSALFVKTPTRAAGISYGGDFTFDKGVKAFVKGYNSEGRKVSMYVLKTTEKQDARLLDFLTQHPDGNVDRNGFGADLMLRQNCTTAVCNTLQSGGVLKEGDSADGTLNFLHLPSELKDSLDSGSLSSEVQALIEFDPQGDAP
jgi:hypothetical protein